ncbi:hypothetical protein ACO0K9_18920 [Undibacterium sp. Ji50W]|uniref:hypothetical protein n=1 Tax=Undibacterium sp. Ji50W TaxID=3413041 RepID=UPI003BF33E42
MDAKYNVLKKIVNRQLKRGLTEDDKACVSSFLSFTKQNHDEMLVLLNVANIYAIAYVEYILTPDIAAEASAFVYDVLRGGMDVNEFMRRLEIINNNLDGGGARNFV